MRIIKLNAIDSTNTFLRQMVAKKVVEDFTIVCTEYQKNGRGRMGNLWNAEKGKNLLCSLYRRCRVITIDEQFYISMATSLAIVKALKRLNIPKLHVKWPNDILSEQKKVCGILIENVIKNSKLEATIIGFGLNVNQTQFKGLPQASSLRIITSKVYDIDEVLQVIIEDLKYYFDYIEKKQYPALQAEYESLLFRKDKPSTFLDAEGHTFPGFVKGITPRGNLIVQLEDEVLAEFESKQIQLRY